MGYLSDGKLISMRSNEISLDREYAKELAKVFKQRTGMDFKQNRFTLLPSQVQNDYIHEAWVSIQARRRRQHGKDD